MQATIRDRVRDMIKYENNVKTNKISKYTAAEQLLFKKRYDKQKKVLEGVRDMHEFPAALVIFDVIEDQTAIREANNHNVKVPVIALCDTNVDPKGVDYIIAGNDNHYKSIAYISKLLSQMYAEAAGIEMRDYQERPPLDPKDIRKRSRYRRHGFRRFAPNRATTKPSETNSKEQKVTPADAKAPQDSKTDENKSAEQKPIKTKQPVATTVKELTPAEVLSRKHTMAQLKEMATKANITFSSKIRKQEMCELIIEHQKQKGGK